MNNIKNITSVCLLIAFFVLSLITSCNKAAKYPELTHLASDSIAQLDNSKDKFSGNYATYLRLTTKDNNIHVEKNLQYDYYPWKVKLGKTEADSFMVHLEQTLAPQKDYKSAFGELPNIESEYSPIMANNVMATLLMGKVVQYDLKNHDGKSITLDANDLSINKNVGVISFGLAKWDLEGQHIKGQVTFEFTLPYHIFKVEVTAQDKGKILTFGDTEITVLEVENNVLHYTLKNDNQYSVTPKLDSCMASSNQMRFPEYFYSKIRTKPNLTYKQFIADSAYFELGKKFKDDVNKVHIAYFTECDPSKIYLYGFKKTEVVTKKIKIPIDAKVS